MGTNRMLTTRDAAEHLKIPYTKVSALFEAGVLVGEITSGGHLRFDKAGLEESAERLKNMKFLAVVTPESWSRLVDGGLSYTLLPKSSSGWADTLREGNQFVFYASRVSRICGSATVSGSVLKKNVVWPQGVFPYTVPLEPAGFVEDAAAGLSFHPFVEQMSWIPKPEGWANSVRTTLRLLPEPDYHVLRGNLDSHLSRGSGRA